ncbi:MAG: M3 family oligoendopeptidase, partial [Xanthomonadales bacterium]|nr:M3 family oligoendopeptidase [Xanthomonadales bacterium]
MNRILLTGVLALAPLLAPLAQERSERIEDTWNLSAIFATPDEWAAAVDALEARVPEIEACEGRLAESAEALLECSTLISDVYREYGQVASYASMSSDADTRVAENQQRRSRAQILGNKLAQATAFISPEVLEAGAGRMNALLEAEPALEPYRQSIRDTLRQAEHTLDEDGEQLLAANSLVQATAFNTYRTLSNADMPWPTITLSDGTEVRLDQAAYTKYRAAENRDDRKAVFDAFWGKWKEFERTYGTTLSGLLNNHVFSARARNYDTTLAAALDGSNIPPAVYTTLLEEVNASLPTLHRYFTLRGRMLGVEQPAYFDIYPPLVELDKEFPLEVGKRLSLESAAPLGPAYAEVMAHGLENRWMDAYPRPGKVSGAYMSPGAAFDVHPFILMNYNDDYESVSTLAHEWGHAMHTYLATKSQPYPTSSYSIFTAEIASTFNEALLLDHMLRQAQNDQERLYYLGSALENLRGTFYRQAMFAEYELAIHEAAERGEPLDGAKFTEMYADIVRRYHGHDQGVMTVDDLYVAEWAYVPHFHYNFYVYQYATSYVAAIALA